MPLAPGTKLGAYEVLAALGAGGMGEVYRARDTKLGRTVAIKVLPATLADDPERIGRFEREARALAALNHPHIATLYGLEESDHETYRHLLVMELVEGETLAERLQEGPLPLESMLAVARQIAEALEAAHEKGIVHRDLKPANVKITPDDQVKVLDFGLAKAVDASAGAAAPTPTSGSIPPTMTSPVRPRQGFGDAGTAIGMILGTAAYMSPEQARGYSADHRSDIFSFGIVLYEMLTGRQPFHGDTVSDVMASVLARDPDLSALPPALNPRLPDLIRRCLEKSPKRRWQAIGDLRAEIEIVAAAPRQLPASGGPAPPAPRPSFASRAVPAVCVALVASAITAGVMWTLRPRPAPLEVTRFAVTLNPKDIFQGNSRSMVAVSPDGRMIAFTYGTPAMIYLRTLSDAEPRPVQGTAEKGTSPTGPMFSPDGRWIAYYSSIDQALKRVPVDGGAPVTICKTELPSGMTWTSEGLVFTTTEGIQRVASSGGSPELLARIPEGETAFGAQLLPGGRTLLFTVAPAGGSGEKWERAQVVVQSLSSGTRKTILEGAADARYLQSRYLVFARAGILFAAPFDLDRLELSAKEAPVIEGVRRGTGTIGSAGANYSVSENGTLVYIPGPLSTVMSQLSLAFFDRDGAMEPIEVTPGPYQKPRLSRDGRRIAFEYDDGRDANIWVYDVGSKAAARRLTFGGHNRSPAWSGDSQHVLFQSDRDGGPAIFWQRADGSGTAERLTAAAAGTEHQPLAWVPNGDRFLFESTTGARTTLWIFSMHDRKATQLAGIDTTQLTGAVFSPDGRWLVYASREPGRQNMLVVEPFPQTGAKYQISGRSEDAHHPIWSPDGKEIVYTPGSGTRLIRLPVVTSPAFSYGAPETIERQFVNTAGSAQRPYDFTRDGRRFVGLGDQPERGRGLAPPQIQVVVNWTEELKARVGIGK